MSLFQIKPKFLSQNVVVAFWKIERFQSTIWSPGKGPLFLNLNFLNLEMGKGLNQGHKHASLDAIAIFLNLFLHKLTFPKQMNGVNTNQYVPTKHSISILSQVVHNTYVYSNPSANVISYNVISEIQCEQR